MNRVQEIEKRMLEIKTELDADNADLNALEVEVRTLKEEKQGILEQAEKRSAMLNDIAQGNVKTTIIEDHKEERKMENTNKFESLEYRQAFMEHVIKGVAIPTEFRVNAITKTTDIGSVIPTTVLNTIVEKLEATGMILPLITRTAIKGGVSIPTSSVKPVATWVAEGVGSDTQKKTTGQITFAYHKLRCAVAVSLEVDTMALSAFETALINNVVEAMVKALEQAIISGTGVGQPKGILTETGAEVTFAEAPTYTTLTDAEAALPLEYENGAVWCMSKRAFMDFAGMVDGQGQPIARVNYGIAGKAERTLLGRTVVLCNYLPATTHSFLFNFKDYVLNTNYNMGLKKYEDNDTDDFVTKAIMIADGKVVVADSLVVVKKA